LRAFVLLVALTRLHIATVLARLVVARLFALMLSRVGVGLRVALALSLVVTITPLRIPITLAILDARRLEELEPLGGFGVE